MSADCSCMAEARIAPECVRLCKELRAAGKVLSIESVFPDHAQSKAAYEQRLEARSEALHDHLHGALPDVLDTGVTLECGCEFRCNGWDRSLWTGKRYPINPRWTVECEEHI